MVEGADARAAATAAKQHGLLNTNQAVAAGLSATQIRRRILTGRWERITIGVYRIRGAPTRPVQRAMAAVLARPEGVISHLNAAELAGLRITGPPVPWLTVPSTSSARSSVARIHRTDLPDDQITTVDGVRTTAGARTLVDCSAVLGVHRLRKLVDEALHLRLATPAAVDAVLDANRDPRLLRRHDVLRDLVEVWRPVIRPGSPAEARLLRMLGEWGLPQPERQIEVRDPDGVVIARLDGGWSDRRIGLEYDSVEWHGPARWASDEARHALVTALGWTLFHVDKSDIVPGATHLRDRLVAAFIPAPARAA